jgi:hypothetical protein
MARFIVWLWGLFDKETREITRKIARLKEENAESIESLRKKCFDNCVWYKSLVDSNEPEEMKEQAVQYHNNAADIYNKYSEYEFDRIAHIDIDYKGVQ